jgi:hypothetical protein
MLCTLHYSGKQDAIWAPSKDFTFLNKPRIRMNETNFADSTKRILLYMSEGSSPTTSKPIVIVEKKTQKA